MAGANIAVDSTVGQGTRFLLRFPLSQSSPPAPVKTLPLHPLKEHVGVRILLVEDNDSVRSYLQRLLRRAGFQIELASSGDQAWARLENATRPPDLILSDVVMPGMTGPQLIRRVLERWPDQPYLLMSGYTGGTVSEEAGMDPDRLLLKPFGAGDLLLRIEALLA
jgi:two-component system cell cycle sensor histidine kinase/response regulator CckA